MPKVKLVTASQMRQIETLSSENGIDTDILMDKAGYELAKVAISSVGVVTGLKCLALIGSGNNGSDGLVAAGHLVKAGAKVCAVILGERSTPDPRLLNAIDVGVTLIEAKRTSELLEAVQNTYLIIDAVLGTGVNRTIEGSLAKYLKLVSEFAQPERKIIAADVPSGVHADTGQVDPLTLFADRTVAFGYPKIGNIQYPGNVACGELTVADIGIPTGRDSDVKTYLMDSNFVRNVLPVRRLDSNKGTFGKVMIVGGSEDFVGAAALAAHSALKSGVGLATVAAPTNVTSTITSIIPEATLLNLPVNKSGEIDGWRSARKIYRRFDGYSTLLIGCGMGVSNETRLLFSNLLLSSIDISVPTVIDADGLNILSTHYRWWDRLPEDCVLTPHPGEMSRLTRIPVDKIQNSRLEIAKEFSVKWDQTLVLKGSNTVVALPNGESWVSDITTPSLSSAGTGDVLAGLISGLIAQGLDTRDAAISGVYIHGVAGQTMGKKIGDSGTVASDLLSEIPLVMSEIRNS